MTHAMQCRGRKAQIAVFLIIGILLLVAAAIVLHIKGKLVLRDLFKFEPLIDDVPLEFRPLKSFVDECLEKTSVEGLSLIGLHGGYIGVIPDTQKYTQMMFKTDYGRPTEADTVAVQTGGNWQVPYWSYMPTENDCSGNCRLASLRPPLSRDEGEHSIEVQLDAYIADQVPKCFANFTMLKPQGFAVAAQGIPEVKTIVGRETVNVYLHVPLHAESEHGALDVANFGLVLPLNLREVYSLASDIANTQMEYRFLEGTALNVIGSFQGVDEEKLPPYAATDFSTSRVSWDKQEVEQKIQDYLAVYTQRLRYANTQGGEYYTFADPVQQGIYDNFVIPTNRTHPGISVEFEYFPFWPLYFSAGRGQRISANGAAVGFPLSWLPIKQYKTSYDLSYPVIVELNYPTTLNNKGYKFYFALEANVRDNTALDTGYALLNQAYLGDVAQFCDENQRNSGDITVTVTDHEGNPVPGTSIYFNARESCLVGSASMKGGKSIFTGRFPIGIGTLIVSKPEYLSSVQSFGTRIGQHDEATAMLYPYKTKRVEILKRSLVKVRENSGDDLIWVLSPEPAVALMPNERVIVTYDREKEHAAQEDIGGALEFKGNESQDVALVPGKYVFTMNFLADDLPPIIIPEDSRGGFLGFGNAEIPEMEVNSDPYYAGDTRVEFEITEQDLYSGSTLMLNTLYVNLPGLLQEYRKIEDLEITGKGREFSALYAAELAPRFG